jgi:hypothetical protein
MSMKELENRVWALTKLTNKDDLEESELKCPVPRSNLENEPGS